MKKIILPLILSLPLYSAANEMSVGGALGLWDYGIIVMMKALMSQQH